MGERKKEINGIKVINRYTFSSFLSGFLTLLISTCFVISLFVPLVTFTNGNNVLDADGIDFILFLFNMDSPLNSVSAPVIDIQGFKFNFFYIFAPIILLGLLLSIFSLFVSLKLLLWGRLNKYKRPKNWSFTIFFFYLILLASFFGVSYVYKLNPNVGISMELGLYPLIILGVSFVIFFINLIIYAVSFKGRIYIGNVAMPTDEALMKMHGGPYIVQNAEANVKPVIKVKEIRKIKYENASSLPPHISSIGGHAFSQNTSLVVALIPNGITTLGPGAFANCPKLKIVSIPTSVKEIGYNCFFNCYSLERINYGGTKEQWRHIRRGSNWLTKAKTTTVVCADGPIIVNPYH